MWQENCKLILSTGNWIVKRREYSLAIALFAREIKPDLPAEDSAASGPHPRFGGYTSLARDRRFMTFILFFTLFQMCSVMLWVLLGVYAKQNYDLPESQYGLIRATNALMVVLFQVSCVLFGKLAKRNKRAT